MKNTNKNKQIDWVCSDCGIEANRLTCLKKYGAEPLKEAFDVSTFHEGVCGVCGKKKSVTEPRDFFYPDFSLLTNHKERDKEMKNETVSTVQQRKRVK